MKQHTSIELLSEEIREFISDVPSWIVRWGTTVFFGVLLVLLASSWIIRYPEVVRGSFKLTSVNAPKPIRTRTDGKLSKLFVQDNQSIPKNATLAYLESTADHNQVLSLGERLDTIARLVETQNVEQLARLEGKDFNRLGELQSAYQKFNLSYVEFLSFLTNGFYQNKQQILVQELEGLRRLEHNLRDQLLIYQQDYQLALQEYAVQEQLAREKVIASLELKRQESRLLAKKMPLRQVESGIISNYNAQVEKRKEMLELDKFINEQKGGFLQAVNTFRSAIESWKQQYVLTAPFAGRVRFYTIVEENQALQTQQAVFYVAPESSVYYGELHIPQENLGKVKEGQKVLVKFSGYPVTQFGVVEGRVEYILELPTKDNNFLAKINLPKGLTTTYGKQVVYKDGMIATGEIITQDIRLLERILFKLREAIQP